MFGHLFKYKLKVSLRDKGLLFWILAFPIILGTLFKVSFGNYMQNEEAFNAIETAYVEGENADEVFVEVLDSLKDDEGILSVYELELEEANKMLEDGDVKGIIINDAQGISLVVQEEGINQTILKNILDQYEQKKSSIETVMMNHPEKLEMVISKLSATGEYINEESLTDGDMDSMMSYFYALIAMTCMYGAFLGGDCSKALKANVSAVAARRCLGSTNKGLVCVADILACVTLQSGIMGLTIVYLKYVLGVNIGDQVGLIFLTSVVGCIIGISQGMLIYSLSSKVNENTKLALSMMVSLGESFLSGLMIGNMKDIVEKHAPIINKINPAALISDALFSLNVYDDYDRYLQSLTTMLIMAVIFVAISYVVIRREKYASL